MITCFDELDDSLDPTLTLEECMPSQKLRDFTQALIVICKMA